MRGLTIAIAATLGALCSPASAQVSSYLGTWKIDSAIVAPWADPRSKPDAAHNNELIGKTVTLTPQTIAGPDVFACKGPHYKLSDFTADMLFQGEFEEMHDRDKSQDPRKLAASLGFAGTTIKTLETGCEIDWHFLDPRTAEIGLNDYVFTLKKQ